MDANAKPSTPRSEYVAALPLVSLIRDLLGGTPKMHEQCATYIPKWKAEKQENYLKRARSAKVYGGLARSLSASVGMLFAKEPEPSDNWPAAMLEHWWNIDGKGAKGPVFAKRRAEDAIADGFGGILVDFPSVPEGVVVTAANEAALNLRPRWAAYQRLDILSWQTAVVNNVETPVQIVLRESHTRTTGEFATETVPAYRILTLREQNTAPKGAAPVIAWVASWRLVIETKAASGEVTGIEELGKGVFRDRTGAPFDVIPLAVGYGGRTDAPFTAHPPLTDLAWCNLQHWQIATEKRYNERLCAYPQPVKKGDLAPTGLNSQDGRPIISKFELGPGVVVNLKADADFFWRELTGASLDKLRDAKQDERDEMGELGASFLSKKTRGVETAEAKRIDSVAENATLATAGQGVEDWLNQALEFHARYLGIPKAEAPTLTLNTDFEMALMDAATMTAWATLGTAYSLPVRMVLEALRDGGRLTATDEELDALEADIMANEAAVEAQKAQAQEDALALAGARGVAQPKPGVVPPELKATT